MTIREALGSVFAVREARLGQMGDMLQITGTMKAFERGHCEEAELEPAVIRCLNCESPDVCKRWLAKAENESAAPSFCPNATQFNTLRLR